jgi:HEAT repeat protein
MFFIDVLSENQPHKTPVFGSVQKPTTTIKILIRQLGSKNERKAIEAAGALIALREEAVPELIKALGSKNILIRRKAVWPLLTIADERAIDPLIAALQYDADAKVRRNAARALGLIGGVRAINPLINAFGDADDRVRWDAAVALEKIGPVAIEALVIALHYGGEKVRAGAVSALGWIRHTSAIESLAIALYDKDAEVRTRAAFALAWIGDTRAFEPLRNALSDDSEQVRMQAAAGLGWLRDPRAVEPLVKLLGEDHAWVPYVATEALSQIGDEQAVMALAFANKYGINPQVREAAHMALRNMDIDPDTISIEPRRKLWHCTNDNLWKKRRCTTNLVIACAQ